MRRLALLAAALLLACGAEPRNLVLVSVDTLRADHLGAYGDPRGLTPNLDALAAESIRYQRAYAPAPLTLPSLAGLLTGRHPESLGVRDNVSKIPEGVPTLAQQLHRRGFRTGAVVANGIAREYTGLATGFERYDVRFSLDWRPGDPERTGLTTDAALRMADGLGGGSEGPLFLWVHYLDPHGPYEPAVEERERLLAGERRRPDGTRQLEVSPNSRGLGAIPRYQYQEPHREVAWYRAGYAGEVARVDREVGRLLAGLSERGILERAVVVFTADHGESLGEDDYWFAHGERLGDASVRVPLLIRVPGQPPELREGPVSLLDVAPTLAGLAGIAWEGGGVDLLGPGADAPRSLLLATGAAAASQASRAVVGPEWKLVRRGDRDSLFRLPDESRDRSAEFEAVARSLGEELDALAGSQAPGGRDR